MVLNQEIRPFWEFDDNVTIFIDLQEFTVNLEARFGTRLPAGPFWNVLTYPFVFSHFQTYPSLALNVIINRSM
jgi:hypothetical protein